VLDVFSRISTAIRRVALDRARYAVSLVKAAARLGGLEVGGVRRH